MVGRVAVTALVAGSLWASCAAPAETLDASGVPDEIWHGLEHGLFGLLLFCAFQ